jgi:hypothetical protein
MEEKHKRRNVGIHIMAMEMERDLTGRTVNDDGKSRR